MPLHLEKKIGETGVMYLWNVTEDLGSVSESFRERVLKTKSGKRKVELIGEYHLAKLTGLLNKISYLDNGKPVLEEGHVTISHDRNLVGFFISSIPVGMDIQRPTEQLERIKHKFCNENELLALDKSDDHLRELTLIWCSKEAIFKIYGENVPFADGMHITIEGEKILCTMSNGKVHELSYMELGDSLVVYSLS